MDHLESCSKWNKLRHNLVFGDVVLVKEPELPRNVSILGRIIEVKLSQDDIVQSVKLRVADSALDKRGRCVNKAVELKRPVHKLVLLLEHETERFPLRSLNFICIVIEVFEV